MAESNRLRPASLDAAAIRKVTDAEQQFGNGVILVAYEQPVAPASLTEDQVAALQDLEQQLGVCLVAYRKRP